MSNELNCQTGALTPQVAQNSVTQTEIDCLYGAMDSLHTAFNHLSSLVDPVVCRNRPPNPPEDDVAGLDEINSIAHQIRVNRISAQNLREEMDGLMNDIQL
jgi:hypothetical protein